MALSSIQQRGGPSRSANYPVNHCILAIKHLPHMLDHAAARIEKVVVFSLEKTRIKLRLATRSCFKNLVAVITSKIHRVNFRSYNYPSTVSMSLQYGYEIWKLADSKWESGRKIPSFFELISKCELPEGFSVNSPRKSVEVRQIARVNQQPNFPYQTPPPSDPNAEDPSSSSSLQTSPSFSSVPASVNLERSFEDVEQEHQTSPGKQLAHQSNISTSSSVSENQCTASLPPGEERPLKSDNSPTKKRRRKARSDLAAHEKIIFSCGPRPATEHSAVELHPQNLLNKDLCFKKNTQCSQCGSKKTPEWRSGPTGSRTLCNACGLFFAKLTKKMGHDAASEHFLNLKKIGNVFDRRIGSI